MAKRRVCHLGCVLTVPYTCVQAVTLIVTYTHAQAVPNVPTTNIVKMKGKNIGGKVRQMVTEGNTAKSFYDRKIAKTFFLKCQL